MCAISKNSYNWDCSESEGKRPKPIPSPHMRLWLSMITVYSRQYIQSNHGPSSMIMTLVRTNDSSMKINDKNVPVVLVLLPMENFIRPVIQFNFSITHVHYSVTFRITHIFCAPVFGFHHLVFFAYNTHFRITYLSVFSQRGV